MSLAILGVTGFTGRLVLDEARRAGLQVRLVGRRGDALEALAKAGEEVRVADARDNESLRRAFAGIEVVASLAGPFLELGLGPVKAAVDAGAHYLDTSGEQQWVGLIHAEVRAGTVVLPAFGFDYVPGDLAARLAAEKVDGPLDELVVAYSVKGVGTSRGTRRTIGHVMGQKQVAWQDGRLVPSSFGATTRSVRFPFGERTVVEWSGTEPLDGPAAHGRPERALVPPSAGGRGQGRRPRPPGGADRPRRLAARPVRTVRGVPRGRAASRSSPRRAGGREAAAPSSRARDAYGLTALLIVRGAEALLAGEARGSGRARPGRGVRRAHARRPARAVPPDRGVMSSGPALTVRVNATAPNAERGRVLRPLLRVAGRGRREGRQRRAAAPPVRDTRLRRAAPFAL